MLFKHTLLAASAFSTLASCTSPTADSGRVAPVQAGPASDGAASASEVVRLTADIDRLVADAMVTERIPGLAVVVVRSGQTILKRGYGVADVATGRAMDPDRALVRIGSVTKTLTALAVTRLTADGRLDMSADVTRFVSNISNSRPSDRPVVIRDLLSHSSGFDQIGIGRQIQNFERPLAERKAARPSLRQFLEKGNLRRVTAPGTLFRYDTYGITLAGAVLEQTTGLPYRDAMRRELFEPLGMTNSFVEAEGEALGRLAKGYGFVSDQFVEQPYEVYVTTPASSIDATPADMGRLLEALTGDGANSHGRLFSADALGGVHAQDFTPQPHCPGATHGFFEGPIGSTPANATPRTIFHTGSMLGFSNLLAIVPEAELGIFVVANRDAEAGGGGVPVLERIRDLAVQQLGGAAPTRNLGLMPDPTRRDLSLFAGDYYWGAHCRTCSEKERAMGGWDRGEPRRITATGNRLRLGTHQYIATTTKDVFLREDGARHMCFGRDARGRVSHYNFSDSPNTFERS